MQAQPEVTVQMGARRFAAIARAVPSTDDLALWLELVEYYGGWGEYHSLTTRTIFIVELAPTAGHT